MHLPNAQEVLEKWISCVKPQARFWIIDLDLATFHFTPPSSIFDEIVALTRELCEANSVNTMAGAKSWSPSFRTKFKYVCSESIPFSSSLMELQKFTRFLRNEVFLYSRLLGENDESTRLERIYKFIDSDVASGRSRVAYGMILWSALTP